jgi:hypothetical protein
LSGPRLLEVGSGPSWGRESGREPLSGVGGAMAGAPMVGVGSGQKNTGPGRESPGWLEVSQSDLDSAPGPALGLRKGLSSPMQRRVLGQQPLRRAKINNHEPQTRFDRLSPWRLSDPAQQSRVKGQGGVGRARCRRLRHGQGSALAGHYQTPRRR